MTAVEDITSAAVYSYIAIMMLGLISFAATKSAAALKRSAGGGRLMSQLNKVLLATSITTGIISQSVNAANICNRPDVVQELKNYPPRDLIDADLARPVALVWQGATVCPGCEISVYNMIKAMDTQFNVFYVGKPSCDMINDDRAVIRRDAIRFSKANMDKATLFAVPGGDDITQTMRAMKQELQQNSEAETDPTKLVQNFLTEKPGKKFFGACMGGYMAGPNGRTTNGDYSVGFGILPIKPSTSYLNIIERDAGYRFPYKYSLVPGLVPIAGDNLIDDHSIWVDWTHPNGTIERLQIFYQDGSYFDLKDDANMNSIKVFGRYINEKGKTLHAIAAMIGTFTKEGNQYTGKVAVSGPHIEAEDTPKISWWRGDKKGRNINPQCQNGQKRYCGNRWNLGQQMFTELMK